MVSRKCLISVAAFALTTLAVARIASAQAYDFKEITLDNGLRVVTLEDFSTPIAAVQVWYHVGSKDEDPNRQGFAHMFEHMMFRGTDRLGPRDHFEYIRQTGGSCNAFTSFDYTAYVNDMPSNQLELALWLEAERMMFLHVDEENFVTERQVVEEERRQDLNEPYGTVAEKVLPVVFKEIPYRWTPIGRIAHLQAAKVDELKAFWNAFYVPNNAVLVISGAVKHQEAQDLAKKYFGWMPRCPEPPRGTLDEPPQTEPREATIDESQGPVPLAGYIFRGVERGHKDYEAIEVLMGVLGYGDSSRLYLDLVKGQQVASQVMADSYGFEKAGVFGAGAALLPNSDIDTVLVQIEKHLQRVIDEPVSERELEKVKNQLRRSLVTDMMTVANKARLLGQASIVHGDPDWLNKQLAEIEAVSIEDLQRVARQYIVPERRSTIRVLPKPGTANGDDADGETPGALQETRHLEARSPKDSAVRPEGFPEKPPINTLLDELPKAETIERTLKNGLKVVIVPNHEVPFATAMLGLKYGAWVDDPAHPGAASMALAMLTKGTEKYTADELADITEYNALSLDGSASMDVSQVSATGLADKMPLALELLAEVVLRPTFPEAEFNLVKQQRIVNLSISEQDPSYQADRKLREVLYGTHPYARSVMGELNDVKSLPLSAAVAWWKTYARPDQATLYVAGDVKPAEVFNLVEESLGSWKAEGEAPNPTLPAIPERDAMRIFLVDRPGAVQSQIRVGQPSITRTDPYYHQSRVFTQIFGGSFGSRLNEVIRVQKGLTYGAGGGFMPGRFKGTFTASTFTKTQTTAETVQALLEVINSMRSTPPTEAEMSVAKSYLVGNLPSQLETPQDAVGYEWVIDYNGLPRDYLNRALNAYRTTTPDDLKYIAENVIQSDKLAVVVVGDASKVKAGLEKIGPVTVVEGMAPAPEAQAAEAPDSGSAT